MQPKEARGVVALRGGDCDVGWCPQTLVSSQRQGSIPVVVVGDAQWVSPPPQLAGLGREQHIECVDRSLKVLARLRGSLW